ncbi:hypothetical protein CSKR_103439 [Clonorchis sinensis]|uniref:G-protein coupled receptors family 1 profile domain-containing protein n=1 Tax=Clonorchis sinensis TaxID=79923 RepID=A0A419PJ54_CLOSI|nr:hypothetical protein CSKR_103439 [Clonorchis sinensis]
MTNWFRKTALFLKYKMWRCGPHNYFVIVMDNHSIDEISAPHRIGFITYSIILLVFGTVGNVLLLATVLYKNVRRSSPESRTEVPSNATVATSKHQGHVSIADKLLIMLTLSDLFCLWVLVLRYTVNLLTFGELRSASQFACLFHTYLSMCLSNLSIVFLCIFCVHRTAVIIWPFAIHTWLTGRCLNICLAVSTVAIFLKHIPVFFIFGLQDTGTQKKCDTTGEMPFIEQGYVYCEFITHCVLGYLILIVSNVCMCIALRKRHAQGFPLTLPATSGENRGNILCKSSRSKNVAYVIALFSLLQLITSIPFFIVIELSSYVGVKLVPENQRLFVYFTLLLATFTNNAINYYVMVGISSKFRADTRKLFELFCCLRFRKSVSTKYFRAEPKVA